MKILHLYTDSLEVFSELTNEEAGILIKAITAYSKDEEPQISGLLKAVFMPFKMSIDRAKEAYLSKVEANRENGMKGGRPPKTEKTQMVISETQKTHVVNLKTQKTTIKEEEEDKEEEEEEEKEEDKENKIKTKQKPKLVFLDELESIEIEEDKIEELKTQYAEKLDWCVNKLSCWLVTKNKKSKGVKSFKAYLSNWVLDAYNTANIQNKVPSINSKTLSQQSNGFARSTNYNAEKVREFEKYGFVFPTSVTYNLDPQDFASCKGNTEKYLELKYEYLKKAIEGSGYNWSEYELKLKEKSKNYLVDGKF